MCVPAASGLIRVLYSVSRAQKAACESEWGPWDLGGRGLCYKEPFHAASPSLQPGSAGCRLGVCLSFCFYVGVKSI